MNSDRCCTTLYPSRTGVTKQNELLARIAELQTALASAREALETLKRPISEFPDSLDYGNRRSVADGCLALIEETLNPHPTAPVPPPIGGNTKDP